MKNLHGKILKYVEVWVIEHKVNPIKFKWSKVKAYRKMVRTVIAITMRRILARRSSIFSPKVISADMMYKYEYLVSRGKIIVCAGLTV